MPDASAQTATSPATDPTRIRRAVLGLIRADLEKLRRPYGQSSPDRQDLDVLLDAEEDLHSFEDDAYKGVRAARRQERQPRDAGYRAFDRLRRIAKSLQGHDRKVKTPSEARAVLSNVDPAVVAAEMRKIIGASSNLRSLWAAGMLHEAKFYNPLPPAPRGRRSRPNDRRGQDAGRSNGYGEFYRGAEISSAGASRSSSRSPSLSSGSAAASASVKDHSPAPKRRRTM
jgi:hypothetical protein